MTNALDILNDILFWACLYVLLWYAYILLFHKAVPNIRTAPAIRKEIIDRLKDEIKKNGKKSYKIIDFGCASGKFSRQLAKSLPEAQIIGLEFSKIAVKKANLLKKLQKIDNLTHIECDFMTYDLSQANAVLVYLTIFQMEEVGQKLKKELKSGALITSNRFQLGADWQPEEIIEVKTWYPHQKNLHIYRKA